MASSVFKITYTTSDKLPEITLSPGSLVFCEDDRSIRFVNKEGDLMNYQSVVSLASEVSRTSYPIPHPALYWVKSTNTLWKYDASDGWIQVTEPPEKQIFFGDRSDFPEVGKLDVLYVDGTTMYRYLGGTYRPMSGGGGDMSWLPFDL